MAQPRPPLPGRDISSLERRLGVEFQDRELLTSALTHRSYAFEEGIPSNERLEFLGDAVLGVIVTDMIFGWFPKLSEGDMAKLRAAVVNMSSLADAARGLGIGDHLLLGRGEELSGGRQKDSILADTFEAVLGAIYLDQGFDRARDLIDATFAGFIRQQVDENVVRDFKTTLQEVAAQRFGKMPDYRITSTGPDHAKQFRAQVFVDGRSLGEGDGRSKKEAEQAAAKEALGAIAAD